jgi:hypothetical protein
MSMIGATIGSIRAIFGNLTPPEPMHRALGKFKQWFSNSPTAYKRLSSTDVRTEQPPPKTESQLPRGADQEMRAKFEAARKGSTFFDVTAFLDSVQHYVKRKGDVPKELWSDDDRFREIVHFALEKKQPFTKEEIGDILKQVAGVELSKRRAIVLEALQQSAISTPAPEMPLPPEVEKMKDLREMEALIPQMLLIGTKVGGVEEKINDLASYFKQKLSPDEQKNDRLFETNVRKELMSLHLDGQVLTKFVEKAKGVTITDKHSAIVLKVMDQLAPKTPSEWLQKI